MVILKEETFRKFGYYPGELKPQSHKKILAACDECGKIRVIQKRQYRPLCPSCSRKGRHHSEETKRKMRGRTPWNKGVVATEETKRKQSDANRGEKNPMFGRTGKKSPTYGRTGEKHPMWGKRGEKSPNFGKHPTEEARRKMRENQPDRSGEKHPMFGKHHTEEAKRKNSEAHIGKHPSEETKRKIGETTKKNWQDPDFIKKVFEGLNAKPNGLEKKVGTILQKHLPNEYAYNGDFSCGITIGGKIPDFVNVNGEKVVIEVFGPWHDEIFMRDRFDDEIPWKRTEFGTKAHYSQFGYKCVVFWQEDLEREDAEAFVLSVLRENKII